ncbi:MAG: MBL fold metallo-hydrolase, partial [Gemmatimonadota bacterium]
MRKIRVANGIWWVEVPQAGLYLLCGCPADSVKHLLRKGLIASEERNGVVCETGPNAILLSDLPIHHQRFANLAEFPVLQMLYRQGMILPGHPNNTGARPLLVGTADQIQCQMAYIYRGNYGLTSVDELAAAGVGEARARELLRLKRRFAFERIRPSEELVEGRVVGDGETELRGGVTIRRRAVNVYDIRAEGETVTVDLNLAPGEDFEPCYDLGFQMVRRDYFSVIHSGDGDGWDTSRPCMSSIVTFQGRIYLIDAGPNLFHSLTALGISVSEIDGVFHTHAHDDHFCGLTILLRADHRLRYYATPLVRASVTRKLSSLVSMEDGDFARYFEVCDLEENAWNNIDGLEVKPVTSPHPVETSVFFFRALWEDGYRTYAHLADITSLKVLEEMVCDDPSRSGLSRAWYDEVKALYATPVDLKKIDIGGGLIHGSADDFRSDRSGRIVLSHTSAPLTDAQKEIGSSGSFGAADVLI